MDSDAKMHDDAGWRYGCCFTKKKVFWKGKKKVSSKPAMLSYPVYFLVFVMALENACLHTKMFKKKESLATF